MANPYFNAAYYLANNPDLVLAGLTEENVEQHYLQYGAAESVNNPARNPNPWFDASFYLRANPDLIQAGLTPADALAHFANYGVYEGRVFSANPALDPSNFDAVDYAERYTDVAEAFDIDPEEELTTVQIGQLLGHFLAYGVNEGRTTADPAFDEAAKSGVIAVVGEDVVLGTSANDTFLWDSSVAGTFPDASVNGLGGDDTIIFRNVTADVTLTAANLEHIEVEAPTAGTKLTVEGKGVQSVSVESDDVFTYVGNLVQSFVVEGDGEITANFGKSAKGASDALEVTTDLDGDFTVGAGDGAGIESLTLNVVEAGVNDGVTVDVGAIKGETFSATINSDAAEIGVALEFDTAADLETVVIDASGANGVAIDASDFTALVGATVTQIGSDGRDKLSGGVSFDVLSGGEGDDEFIFADGAANAAAVEDGKLGALDTITDFEEGDVVTFTTALTVEADGAGAGWVVADGILTFDYGFLTGKSLEDVLVAFADASLDAVVFEFGNNAYVYSSSVASGTELTDAELLKLVGVSASDLSFDGSAVEYAPVV